MKRIVAFVLFSILLCFCSCKVTEAEVNETPFIAQEESISEEILRSIEGEYEKDSRKPEYTTTPGMIALNEKYADKWEAVSEEYYDKILAVLEDSEYYDRIINITSESPKETKEEFRKNLDKLKASYDEYAKNRLEFYAQAAGLRYAGGTIFGPKYATQHYELKKEYALQLVGIYEELTFDFAGY